MGAEYHDAPSPAVGLMRTPTNGDHLGSVWRDEQPEVGGELINVVERRRCHLAILLGRASRPIMRTLWHVHIWHEFSDSMKHSRCRGHNDLYVSYILFTFL